MTYWTSIPQGPEIPGLVKQENAYTLPGMQEPEAYVRIYERDGGTEWQISRLYVSPMLRRQGIAGRLLRLVAIQADIKRVTLSLAIELEGGTIRPGDLKRFYQAYGFTEKPEDKGCMVRRPR